MSTGEQWATTLWRDIDAVLTQARVSRPLHQEDALLDLDRLTGGAVGPLRERLALALEGWDGRLLLRAVDNGLAPDIGGGDQLVISTEAEARDGDLVVAFTAGTLLLRRLRVCGGRHWLVASECDSLQMGPLVAIVGVAVAVRRALRRPDHT